MPSPRFGPDDPNDPLAKFYADHPELKPGGSGSGSTAKPSSAPAAPPVTPTAEKPAGTEVSPGRVVSPNGLTEYTLNPTTHAWDTSPYPPNAADKAAAGVKPAAGTAGTAKSETNYAVQNQNQKSAVQLGSGLYKSDPPAGAKTIGPGSATANGITWHQDATTGNWSPGFATSKAEGALALRNMGSQNAVTAIANSGQANSHQLPTAPQQVAAAGTPPIGAIPGAAGMAGTLEQQHGATLPGFEAFNQPGAGISAEGMHTLYGQNGDLNTLHVSQNGPQIQFGPGQRGPGQFGNSINFGGGASGQAGRGLGGSGGYVSAIQPQDLFGQTAVSVPGSYVQGQGNVGDANRAIDLPFNIGPGGASMAQLAGSNVQVNSPDKGTGYGTVINAMPSSNMFAATGRVGNTDPALQAIQTLQLQAALNQFGGGPGAIQALTAANPNQYSGWQPGTNNGPFSGNGGSGQGNVFANTPGPQNTPWVDPNAVAPPPAAAAPPPAEPSQTYSGGRGMSAPAPFVPGVAPVLSPADTAQTAINAATNIPGINTGGFNPANAGAVVAGGLSGANGGAAGGSIQDILAAIQSDKDKEGVGSGDGGFSIADRGYSKGGTVRSVPMGAGMRRPLGFANGGDVIAPVEPGKTAPEMQQPNQQQSGGTAAQQGQAAADSLSGGTIAGDTSTTNSATPAGSGSLGPTLSPTPSAATVSPAMASGFNGSDNTTTTAPTAPNLSGSSPQQLAQLQPFLNAAQHAAAVQHAREGEQYIRNQAGLGKPTEVPYFGGGQQQLGAGQYLGTGTWLNNLIGSIQGKQQQYQELGGASDPTATLAQINTINQQMAPYQQAQGLATQIQGYGQTGDPAALQTQIAGVNQQMGPLAEIVNANQTLTALGAPVDQETIGSLTGQIDQLGKIASQQLQPVPEPGGLTAEQMIARQKLIDANAYLGPQIAAAQQQLPALKNQLDVAMGKNQKIQQATEARQNLLNAAGLTWDQVNAQTGQYQSQLGELNTQYKNAQAVAALQSQLGNLLGPNVTAAQVPTQLAAYQAQLNPLQTTLGNIQQAGQVNSQLNNLLATPLPGFSGGGSMVTPERIWGVGDSGKVYFQMGEPQHPGGPNMAERATIDGNKLNITPLNRPAVPMGAGMQRVAA